MSTNTRTLKIDKSHIEQQLIDGNLGVAIKMMLAILKAHDSSDHNDMILQSGRYNGLQKSILNGTMSDNNAQMNTNRINQTVRHYWSKLKPQWTVEFAGIPDEAPAASSPAPASSGSNNSRQANATDTNKKIILFLSANPSSTRRLSIAREMKEIQEGIKLSKGRDNFEIVRIEAADIQDFRRAVMENRPNVIHFSGHGSEAGRIILHGNNDSHQEIDEVALGQFFAILVKFGMPIECVFLNACYSKAQAQALEDSIPYVIGMKDKVKDTTAIAFATSFYEVLASGSGYEAAFEIGKVNIMLEGLSGEDLPVLHKKDQ